MSGYREEWAAVLETVARDGLPDPRDLDVALDALEGSLGLSAETLDGLAGGRLKAVPADFVAAAKDVSIARELTSVPLKLRFAEARGLGGIDAVHGWMLGAHARFEAALVEQEESK